MIANRIETPIQWQSLAKTVSTLFAKHHNQLQFFGYEVANIILVIQGLARSGTMGFGFNLETMTALFFLAGSACIWRFDPTKRPQYLCFGGLLLMVGGVFLIAAGYGFTGWAVVLASLESARGGLLSWQEQEHANLLRGGRLTALSYAQLRFAQCLLGWYGQLVTKVSGRFQHLGRFINDRPFLTGTLIKAPFRLEFIIKKWILGDWVGVCVGLSWMILGDGGLAFNDEALKARILSEE
ncbi:MAG: hypothetical protein AAF629_00430 [Chloroflexota bacterium]